MKRFLKRYQEINEGILKSECAWCKKELPPKIGDYRGEGISHGICRDCYADVLANLDKDLDNKNQNKDNE